LSIKRVKWKRRREVKKMNLTFKGGKNRGGMKMFSGEQNVTHVRRGAVEKGPVWIGGGTGQGATSFLKHAPSCHWSGAKKTKKTLKRRFPGTTTSRKYHREKKHPQRTKKGPVRRREDFIEHGKHRHTDRKRKNGTR